MDLRDPNVRNEFVSGVLSIVPEHEKTAGISKDVIEKFVLRMADTESEYPISLSEIEDWFHINKDTLKRLIDPTLARSNRSLKEDLRENRDFVYLRVRSETSKTKYRKEMFVTLDTFSKIIFRLQTDEAKILQAYYRAVEKLYREWAGEVIATKQKAEKLHQIPKGKKVDIAKLPKGDLAYLWKLKQNNQNWLKDGHSGALSNRIVNLQFRYPGDWELLKSKIMTHPSAQEECYKRLMKMHKIKCTKAPCPTEIFYDDEDSDLAWDTCSEGQDEILHNFLERRLKVNAQGPRNLRLPEGHQGFIFRIPKKKGTWKII